MQGSSDHRTAKFLFMLFFLKKTRALFMEEIELIIHM